MRLRTGSPPLRPYITISALLASGAFLAAAVHVPILGLEPRLFVLQFIFGAYLLCLGWLRATMSGSGVDATLLRLGLLQWILAALLVLIEPWFIHMTPIMVMLPLLLAAGGLEVDRYRVFSWWATGLVALMAIAARRLPEAPLHRATTGDQRTIIALVFTPTLVVFVCWVAWRSHASLSKVGNGLIAAAEKLRSVETDTQEDFRSRVSEVRNATHIAASRLDELSAADIEQLAEDHLDIIADVAAGTQSALSKLRDVVAGLDHGTEPVEFRYDMPHGASSNVSVTGETLDRARNVEQPAELNRSLRGAAAFAGLCLLAGSLVYCFVVRDPLMLRLLGFLVISQTVPAFGALYLAHRSPNAALFALAFSCWVPPIVFAFFVGLVQVFIVPGMLIPIVISLPHVEKARVRLMSLLAACAIALMIGVARLSQDAEVMSRSPDDVNDLIVITLLALGTFAVLWLSERNHHALVVRNQALADSARTLRQAYAQVHERLEGELHDGAQQRFIAARIHLEVASAEHEGVWRQPLGCAADQLREAARALMTLDYGPTYPMSPEEFESSLQRVLVDETPRPVTLFVDLPMRVLDAAVVSTLWFCCSEARTNVLKHAGESAEMVIDLRADPYRGIVLNIEDNGTGFDCAAIGEAGSGLKRLEERFRGLHGSFAVESSAMAGTRLVGVIPADFGSAGRLSGARHSTQI